MIYEPIASALDFLNDVVPPHLMAIRRSWCFKNTSFLNGQKHPQQALCIAPPVYELSEGFVNASNDLPSGIPPQHWPTTQALASCGFGKASGAFRR